MNTNDLISKVAENTGSSKADAKKFVDAVVAGISSELTAGNEVSLNGFGKFTVKDRAARMGRNPATGAEVQIPASKAVAFKAGKGLKDRL